MFKKILLGLFILFMSASAYWLITYFINNSGRSPEVFKTEAPFVTDIIEKTVATGSIVPRREVTIKPQASGIIDALYVEAGDQVTEGDLIARVKFVQSIAGSNADQMNLNNAQATFETAQVNFNNAELERDRQEGLYKQKVISQREYQEALQAFNVQKENLNSASRNLELVKRGILQNSGAITNEIYSTVTGMVLDVPVKVGASVIERNNFNEGTTIATIADMESLVFEGQIDESEVGKIKEGMTLDLNIGAIEGKKFKAELEYISPKGIETEGAINFDIRAKILLKEKDFLRAGYSANADIILGKKEKVLAIKESMLQFEKKEKESTEKGKPFVEVEKGEQQFEKRKIETGISDGINIEVKKGLKKEDKVKIPISEEDKD